MPNKTILSLLSWCCVSVRSERLSQRGLFVWRRIERHGSIVSEEENGTVTVERIGS